VTPYFMPTFRSAAELSPRSFLFRQRPLADAAALAIKAGFARCAAETAAGIIDFLAKQDSAMGVTTTVSRLSGGIVAE
jgi:hypothetical protein